MADVESSSSARLVIGWRRKEIEITLDLCANSLESLYSAKVDLVDSRGRSYSGYATQRERNMAWHRRNVQASRANSCKQAKTWRLRVRNEWAEYCAAYLLKFPGTSPIGFDRWSRYHRAAWLQIGAAGLQINLRRDMRTDIQDGVDEGAAAKVDAARKHAVVQAAREQYRKERAARQR